MAAAKLEAGAFYMPPYENSSGGLAVLGQAALVTFIVFAAFGAYGLMTRRNLSSMSKVLFVGL